MLSEYSSVKATNSVIKSVIFTEIINFS